MNKITSIVLEAMKAKGVDVNYKLIDTILKYKDELNHEYVKRIVEATNQYLFAKHKQSGKKLSDDFEIADPNIVLKGVFKELLPDLSRETTPSYHPDDCDVEIAPEHEVEYRKCASYKNVPELKITPTERKYTGASEVWSAKEPNIKKSAAKRDNSKDTLRYYLKKVANYRKLLNEVISQDKPFLMELRYMYPESTLLKSAGLSDGPKIMPDVVLGKHEDFIYHEEITNKLLKIAAKLDETAIVDQLVNRGIEKKDATNIKNKILDQKSFYDPTSGNLKGIFTSKGKLSRDFVNEVKDKKIPVTFNKSKDSTFNINGKTVKVDPSTIEEIEEMYGPKVSPDYYRKDSVKIKEKPKSFSEKWKDTTKVLEEKSNNTTKYVNALRNLGVGAHLEDTPTLESISRTMAGNFMNPVNELAKSIGVRATPHTLHPQDMKAMLTQAEKQMDQALSAIDLKSNFERIMHTDPYLQGTDKDILLRGYRQAHQLAPLAMANPGVLQSYLRTVNAHGGGGIDAQTATQLVKLDKALAGGMINWT